MINDSKETVRRTLLREEEGPPHSHWFLSVSKRYRVKVRTFTIVRTVSVWLHREKRKHDQTAPQCSVVDIRFPPFPGQVEFDRQSFLASRLNHFRHSLTIASIDQVVG